MRARQVHARARGEGLIHSFEQVFQAFEHERGVPQDRAHSAVEQDSRASGGSGGRCVVPVIFISLLLDGTFEGDWEGDRYSSELERELGSAAEVKVGEFAESVLDLEQARDLRVQSEETGTTC